ncbi:MAG: hypothetical protein ABSH17_12500 [Syntrophobacteraceae bacterium]
MRQDDVISQFKTAIVGGSITGFSWNNQPGYRLIVLISLEDGRRLRLVGDMDLTVMSGTADEASHRLMVDEGHECIEYRVSVPDEPEETTVRE